MSSCLPSCNCLSVHPHLCRGYSAPCDALTDCPWKPRLNSSGAHYHGPDLCSKDSADSVDGILTAKPCNFCFFVVAVNPPNEDELFEAKTSAKVSKAEDLPLLMRTGETLGVAPPSCYLLAVLSVEPHVVPYMTLLSRGLPADSWAWLSCDPLAGLQAVHGSEP
jgi:hypothetical protein